ncbi:MAG: hypothetical protein M1836_005270 [Candelina mexicana]|nr:MAG: hypothetical protein M1836_005270 [Candelina mexicana]
MAPPGGSPENMWKLSFARIFGFPLPGQIEYMVISSVQSLIATSGIIRDAFLDDRGSGGQNYADMNFSNKQLVQQLQGYYWGLSVGFEDLLGVPFANLQQNMQDTPNIMELLRTARDAAISDMNMLASMAKGETEVVSKTKKHRADRHPELMRGEEDAESSRARKPRDRYRPDRYGRFNMGDPHGEPSTVRHNMRTDRPDRRGHPLDNAFDIGRSEFGEDSMTARPDRPGYLGIDFIHGESPEFRDDRHMERTGQRPDRIRGYAHNRAPRRTNPIELGDGDMQEEPPRITDRAGERARFNGQSHRDRRGESELDDGEAIGRRRGKQRADRVGQHDSSTTRREQALHNAAAETSHPSAERPQAADQKKWEKQMEEMSLKLARELEAEERRNFEPENADSMALSFQEASGSETIESFLRRPRNQHGVDSSNHRQRLTREASQRKQAPSAGGPQAAHRRRRSITDL